MSSTRKSRKQIHHNIPQLLVNLIFAQITICLWGRGTGKTEGPIADFIYRNVRSMPRSLGGIVSVTYDKMLVFIIPKLIKAWERMGYHQNIHFWVRKKAPKEFRIKEPHLPVADYKHFIHHANGAGNQLISMDRLGIGNAGDLDYLALDEARLVKKDNFDEVLNANRGNDDVFGHLSNHHSILICSDMPRDQKGRWLLDYFKQVDPDIIEMIFTIQLKIYDLKDQLSKKRSEKSKNKVERIIQKYEADLNDFRKKTVYVSEASTFDNVHALGLDTIKNLRRVLSDYIWQLSVLNKRIAKVEDGFYGLFDEDKFGYTASNHSHMDSISLEDYSDVRRDSRWDSDVNRNKPLDIALDHNKAINWLVVGQDAPKNKHRTVNSFFVKDPQRLRHVLQAFISYYEHHKNKTVYYWYDHNSTGEDSSRDYSFADEVYKTLRKADWTVIKKYIGQAPGHKAKFEFWNDLLEGKNKDLPSWEINSTTNEILIRAIDQADVIIGKNGYEKDKTKEKDKSFPQEEAPHGTDALDILVYGKFALRNSVKHSFPDIMSG